MHKKHSGAARRLARFPDPLAFEGNLATKRCEIAQKMNLSKCWNGIAILNNSIASFLPDIAILVPPWGPLTCLPLTSNFVSLLSSEKTSLLCSFFRDKTSHHEETNPSWGVFCLQRESLIWSIFLYLKKTNCIFYIFSYVSIYGKILINSFSLRTDRWVFYFCSYLCDRASTCHIFIQKFGVKSESTPVFLSTNLSFSPQIATDSDSRQKWEIGANMEGSKNLFIYNCSLFDDIHIVKWGWRCGNLWFFNSPSVKMLIFSLNLKTWFQHSKHPYYHLALWTSYWILRNTSIFSIYWISKEYWTIENWFPPTCQCSFSNLVK